MSITIEIAPYLRPFIENRTSVVVGGTNIQECIGELVTQFPGFKEWLFDSQGTLKVLIIVNGKVIPQQGFNLKLGDNDHIRIIMPLDEG
ncbi:MoaD/ThiS family protein [bacterium]|nr:MoaD/ThiS family protein [bacterium]